MWINNPFIKLKHGEQYTNDKYNIVQNERKYFLQYITEKGINKCKVKSIAPHLAYPCPGCQKNIKSIQSFRNPNWIKKDDSNCMND